MESSPWPENLPSNRKKAIQELTQGKELANKLRQMLRQTKMIPASLDGVVGKILGTFDNTLSIFSSSNSNEVSQIQIDDKRRPPNNWDGRKSEDSDESVKTATPTKTRRGCYKRKKISETHTKITSVLIDDGHAWRKYGQKDILNAKHQRNYYRCTHRFDQGCQATKQVQKTEDEPPKFNITYNGRHTCKNLLKAPQIILDSPNPRDSSILNFETKEVIGNKQVDPYFPSIKHEQHDDDFYPASLRSQSFPSDYYLSQDLLVELGSSEPLSMVSSGSNHEEIMSSGVYSSMGSTHSYEMDNMLENIDFVDFPFEF